MIESLVLFATTAGVALLAALAWSVAFPQLGVWPKPELAGPAPQVRRALHQVIGIASSAILLLVVGLAVATRAPAGLGQHGLGGSLFFAGGLRGHAGDFSLGAAGSHGARVPLVAAGVYRYSRNPQYVGAVGVLLGAVIASASTVGAVPAILSALWFLIAPFAEEAALREAFGDPYRAYLRSAPRYLGRPKHVPDS